MPQRTCPVGSSYLPSRIQHGMLFHYPTAAHPGVDIKQVVIDHCEDIDAADMRLHDWRWLDEAEADSAFDQHLLEDRRRGFDLAQAPLLRLAVCASQ